MPKIKISKYSVDKIRLKERGQEAYWDRSLSGFGLIVGKTAKTYVVQRDLKGKSRRISIGKHGVYTPEEARSEARELLNKLCRGIDPIEERKQKRILLISLGQAFEEYLEARDLKIGTAYDYKVCFDAVFDDWRTKPIASITKDMISRRHQLVGETRGKSYANGSMRIFSAIYNHTMMKYVDERVEPVLPPNPVNHLSRTRTWYKEQRRKTYIKNHQLPEWFKAVVSLQSPEDGNNAEVVRDYLIVLLFTGLRKTEAATLRWENVDLIDRTITIENTKNYETHIVPISEYLFNLLVARKKVADTPLIFPSSTGTGCIADPRVQLKLVRKRCGNHFIIHDLRRTFITIAESLDIPAYALKRLLNHSTANDVTAGYIVSDVDRLRQPMERISSRILDLANIHPESVHLSSLGPSLTNSIENSTLVPHLS